MRYVLFVFFVYVVVGGLVYLRPWWWRGNFTTWQKLITKNPALLESFAEASPFELTSEEWIAAIRWAVTMTWPYVALGMVRQAIRIRWRAHRIARIRSKKT